MGHGFLGARAYADRHAGRRAVTNESRARAASTRPAHRQESFEGSVDAGHPGTGIVAATIVPSFAGSAVKARPNDKAPRTIFDIVTASPKDPKRANLMTFGVPDGQGQKYLPLLGLLLRDRKIEW